MRQKAAVISTCFPFWACLRIDQFQGIGPRGEHKLPVVVECPVVPPKPGDVLPVAAVQVHGEQEFPTELPPFKGELLLSLYHDDTVCIADDAGTDN
jgi:hypothetical protein